MPDSITRRDALRAAAAAAVSTVSLESASMVTTASASTAPAPMSARRGAKPLRVVVVGAGAFGGWAALTMQRRGAQVTLVDAWGAGNSRASSGDETRVIRAVYNGDAAYTDMVMRARDGWREAEARWQRQVFHRTGALYMFEGDDVFIQHSLPLMQERKLVIDKLDDDDARRRYPQVNFDGVHSAYFEPEAGYLLARQSCELVREEFVRVGGQWHVGEAQPGAVSGPHLDALPLTDGTRLKADAFLFACGPWLGALFPDAVGTGITPTRQETVYLGLPMGDRRYDEGQFPTWINVGERFMYGIPGNERRGIKVADDTSGTPGVDPTTMDRVISPESIRIAKEFAAKRFPGLAGAPVSETRVCQYEFSPKGDFLLDRHPGTDNVWLAGGGSGHGFKMGPAVGAELGRLMLDGGSPLAKFSYTSFAAAREAAARSPGALKHS